MSESELMKALGPAIFSRIGCCIKFEGISVEQKCVIIEKWYTQILKKFHDDEQAHIVSTDILEWFKNNANRYDNIRILKGKLKNAIFDELTCRFVINNSDQYSTDGPNPTPSVGGSAYNNAAAGTRIRLQPCVR